MSKPVDIAEQRAWALRQGEGIRRDIILATLDELERLRGERERILDPLLEALVQCEERLGCGDNSCRFKKQSGMATNGGCRCGDRPFVLSALAALYKAAMLIREGK